MKPGVIDPLPQAADGAVIGAGDVLAALRAATTAQHQVLDSSLALAGSAPDLADYRNHLGLLRAWLAPLEHWLAGFQDGPQGADAPPALGRTALLDIDLAHPSMPSAEAAKRWPDARPWPAHASAAYRWGVCYVVEGAQLGGAVLYRRLSASLAPHPLGYLNGQGVAPGARWRAFTGALCRAVVSAHEIDDACAGATAAFERILTLHRGAR